MRVYKDRPVVAIPTFMRYDTLKNKTLNMLENEDFPKGDIYIFFATKGEKEKYGLGNEYPNQIVGLPGLTFQRNFICSYFDDGQEIMWLDDDLSEIKTVFIDPEKAGKAFQNSYKDSTVKELIEIGFSSLEENECSLFGVYPVNNKGFMKVDSITTDLRYIIGCCYGTINDKELFTFDVNEKDGGSKEDFLRTLMVYEEEGKVVRINSHTAITKYYKEEGGLQSGILDKPFGTRLERDTLSMNYICERFKGMAFPNMKNGYPEIKLKDKRGR